MYEPRYYDSPPVYSPPYSTTSQSFYPPRSVQSPQSQYVPYAENLPPDSYYVEEKPQHFYRWFSAPGFVKTFQGATTLMCFLIFAFVASTLVWDLNGFGYGGYGLGATADGVQGSMSGYYGGSYGYSSSYMTPQSAKSAMISMASINFLVSLGFLVGSFSRSPVMRGCRFYLTVFISNIILAVLQGIIDIIYVIGVNPMSQSSQSMLYNPMLMMCQNMQGNPSLSGSAGFPGFPGGLPMYNQYLHHYCYMDPEEAVAFVLGLLVVLALSLSAYYAYKTRSKIWRHGKPNIYWEAPLVRQSEGQDVQDWVDHVGEVRSTQQAPTFVVSERAAPDLRAENSVVSYGNRAVSIHSEEYYNSNSFHSNSSKCAAEPLQQKAGVPVYSSSSTDEDDSIRKPPYHEERDRRTDRVPRPAAHEIVESQYETGYTTGDTGNELDRRDTDHLFRLFPEIISEDQRQQYKREFESDLARYKSLCAEMDDISDQMHKLNRELDILEEGSVKYQGVADEYNRLKDLKKSPDHQAKKKRCKELRQKLYHLKRLVKNFDRGLC